MAVSLSEVIGIAKKISQQQISIGITKVEFVNPDILKFTLADSSIYNITIPNLHTHSNLSNILEKFTVDVNGKLLFDGKPIEGSGGSSVAIDVTYTDNGVTNVNEALDKIFNMLYVPPSVTSFTHTSGILEKGVIVPNITLNWTINKDIVTQNLSDVGDINPLLRTYTITGANVSNTKTYTLTVNDGKNSTSKSCVVNFVSPIYYGCGVPNLTPNDIKNMNKIVKNKSNTNTTISPIGEVFYFAYDKNWGLLSNIVDPNGFSIINDYKIRQEQIIGLDGIPYDYYIYEYNNSVLMSDFTINYMF